MTQRLEKPGFCFPSEILVVKEGFGFRLQVILQNKILTEMISVEKKAYRTSD